MLELISNESSLDQFLWAGAQESLYFCLLQSEVNKTYRKMRAEGL